jgi:hypothetical protein
MHTAGFIRVAIEQSHAFRNQHSIFKIGPQESAEPVSTLSQKQLRFCRTSVTLQTPVTNP